MAGRAGASPSQIECIGDSSATEIRDPHPPDSDLPVAGEHCVVLRTRKTVNH
jgi:hypothetical protein